MIEFETNPSQPVSAIPRRLLEEFNRAFPGRTPDVLVRAPGCANLLGGHVDMHEGLGLNIAMDRAIWIAATYGVPDLVHLHAADLKKETAFSLKELERHCNVVGDPLDFWAMYPAGMAWSLHQCGLHLSGISAVYLGTVPPGAGLSASAAVEMGFAVAWQALDNWQLSSREMALAGVAVERGYIGREIGMQDQFTALHARSDHAIMLDCRSLAHELVSLPEAVRVVICDTNTRRDLAQTKAQYNTRVADARAAARTIGLVEPDVKVLRDVSPDMLEQFRDALTPAQYLRARHVVTEIARVRQGVEALIGQDLAAFGTLMNESYRSASQDYGSSTPALDAMWQAATTHPGCYGARYSGGGSGGALVALVEAGAASDFIAQTAERYVRTSGQAGDFFITRAVAGAGVFL